MTVQEIREMLDSTITANGRGEITARALNLAFHAILDHIEGGNGGGSGSGNGLAGSSITILLPTDDNYKADNESPILIENNIKCFEALQNQTEPLIIFLQYLGAPKPLSQIAMRLRHLFDVGEGESFYAVGYPSAYSDDHIYGGWAFARDMYKLTADGKITKIDINGFATDEGIIPTALGSYTQTSTGATAGSTYWPRIWKDESEIYHIENCFGNSVSEAADAVIVLEGNTLTVKGGWTHPMYGPIDDDIEFEVAYETRDNGTIIGIESFSLKQPVTLGGFATFETYTMTKVK